MNVQQLLSGKTSNIAKSPQVLRPGQIIQGKIMKLYPNQKAQIQLGTQKVIAQLEASLSAGGKYHFQVQPSDDVVHLRVIGEQLQNHSSQNMMALLQQLGMKTSGSNVALLQALIKEKIPFTKEQLQRAFQLLNSAKNRQTAQQTIKGMISSGLPITDMVYQALASVNAGGMTDQMTSVLNQLRQTPDQTSLQQNLMHRINQILEPSPGNSTLVKQIVTEASNNNQQLFQALKVAGAIDAHVDFSKWKAEWTTSARQDGSINGKQPFQLNRSEALQLLEALQKNGVRIRKASQVFVQQWSSTIENAALNKQSISGQDFWQLKQQLTKSLMPLMSGAQHEHFAKLIQNNPVQLQQLLTTLQTMAGSQTYTTIENVLTPLKTENTFLFSSPKEQFLSQIQQVLQSTGLTYENQLAKNQFHEQQNTIKSMLLQLVQQNDGAVSERSQQLLHFLNGMQLQSVHETANVIQAHLQVPGQKLGLPDDLQLDFSGHKTEDGKINPDSCRILFYLDFANLNETIIDMHIQKRNVSITIFNDRDNLTEQSAAFKPMLQEGLGSLDYQLSAIIFKPIYDKNQSANETIRKTYQKPYQGVDYRI
ncbi:hypothetical protein SAMN04488072_109173 [Lentibacillus halodurans]|uniref:Hook-length control protein FliK n=1 Tax=Lentibacillus halodurans TaxID=237679 RepID=A0A1I0Z4S7_9BACI|nr:hypothetical protein [Lentibacillus halodurans]SFB20614.1 hypothetical protein SAMN04488072_109173 [Lentibacillus halodurans]